jgi:hypothetical protein
LAILRYYEAQVAQFSDEKFRKLSFIGLKIHGGFCWGRRGVWSLLGGCGEREIPTQAAGACLGGGEKGIGFVKGALRHGAGRALAGKGKRVLLGSGFGLEAE